MTAQLEIILIASVVAVACALPGVFLVLRKMSLMSDAISHAILPGIVIMFFIMHDLESPLLMVGAVIMGLITVSLTELLNKTQLVKEDAAIGMVFPLLFSIGVILVSLFAGNIHLDVDAVLLGELAFAPFDRFELFGVDIAPRSLVQMSVILLLNLALIGFIYKEMKLSTFDPGLAAALGFLPGLIHYLLMISVSITAVGAFDSVGSILVVALMIAPPAAAYLLTDNLKTMLILAAVSAVVSAVSGYWVAHALDVSIAGSMAGMAGVVFLLAFLFAPKRGLIAMRKMREQQRWEFAEDMLIVHLLHHEDRPEADTECLESHLLEHINWKSDFARDVVSKAVQMKLIVRAGDILKLTDEGRNHAVAVMSR